MTREELVQYSKLSDKFYEACKRYCKAMERYSYFEYCDIDTFDIDGMIVCGKGRDQDGDYCSVSFNAEYLLMTNEKLNKYVQDQISKRKKEQEEKNRCIIEAEETASRKLYEKLKKRFG